VLFKSEIQAFIDANIGTSISKLALQNPFPDVDWIRILKIEAKSKQR
jgi:hypothetical protein